jgi:hypothetical protein
MKWHSGPPPSIGWWPASMGKNPDMLRWWDGKRWSEGAPCWVSAEEAARYAKKQNIGPSWAVQWTDRPASWPERSRT